ncbi:MAG: MFS transporter, partial [Paludibacteraceae bacterium]|nr:MFS transporter [Paludibacteraceae bacterium]
MKNLKFRLTVMNFLQYAVWGAYLICMSRYLAEHGMGTHIGIFYSVQGIVSIFMPALMGIVADRWIPAQKLLGICHGIAGILMLGAGFYGVNAGEAVEFGPLFGMYALSVAFYMPTIALSNAVAFNALVKGGFDTVKDYPPIRVFGTVGFIAMEVCVDAAGLYTTAWQFVVSGALSAILAVYSFTLPNCDIKKVEGKVDLVDALGLRAFALFKQKKMALFFIFCMGLGV